MEKAKKIIGERLRFYRQTRGVSQEEFAHLLGRSTNTVSNIERGKHFPSLQTLILAAEAFQFDIRDLLDGLDLVENKSRERVRLESEMSGLLVALSDKELAAVIKTSKAIISVRE